MMQLLISYSRGWEASIEGAKSESVNTRTIALLQTNNPPALYSVALWCYS